MLRHKLPCSLQNYTTAAQLSLITFSQSAAYRAGAWVRLWSPP